MLKGGAKVFDLYQGGDGYSPLLSREIKGEFHVNSISKTFGELLETMVREAHINSFKNFDRKLKQQQEIISELKESVGMIQRQLRSFGANITPHPVIRTSAYDIRNFRRKLGITQEVFAQILHVNMSTVIRWEKDLITPQTRHRNKIRELKMMKPSEIEKIIQEAKTALYE